MASRKAAGIISSCLRSAWLAEVAPDHVPIDPSFPHGQPHRWLQFEMQVLRFVPCLGQLQLVGALGRYVHLRLENAIVQGNQDRKGQIPPPGRVIVLSQRPFDTPGSVGATRYVVTGVDPSGGEGAGAVAVAACGVHVAAGIGVGPE